MEYLDNINSSFKVLDEERYFTDASVAMEYAKNNPGKVIVRADQIASPLINVQEEEPVEIKENSPAGIFQKLSQYVISQDEAKREVATALYYHKIKLDKPYMHEEIKSNPLMLVGATGTGKTFIVQKACELLELAYVHVDTASMVSEGIIGNSIGDIAREVVERSGSDIYKARHCVVFLDEFDKLFMQEEDDGASGKVSSQLLRFIEGENIKYRYRDKNDDLKEGVLATHDIQFILGGAFQWILDEDKETISMGFTTASTASANKELTLEDFYRAGLPKELLGRINTIINLQTLEYQDYYAIMTKSENSPLQEFIDKMNYHDCNVDIDEVTLQRIAKEATDSVLGVRSLKQSLQKLFQKALFDAPNSKKTYYIRYES